MAEDPDQTRSTPVFICVSLDPRALDNPDLDLRYLFPSAVEKRSGGRVVADGYDYEPVEDSPRLHLFFRANREDEVQVTIEVIESERLLGNDLTKGTLVAVKRSGEFRVIWPESAGTSVLLVAP